MYSFETIQQALNYVFDGKKLTIIYLPNIQYPWFIAHEIKSVIEYNPRKDTWDMIHKNIPIEYSDFIAKLSINDPIYQNSVENFDLPKWGGARSEVTIIALPALFELLSNSRMPKAKQFRYWLNTEVLPVLYNNPELTRQIHEQGQQLYKQGIQIENLQRELNDARQMGTYYFNSRKKIIQERNIYRNNPHYMLEYYRNLLETDPSFEREARGEDGFTLIGVPNPNFDEKKYNKVLARIKMCEDMLKGYLD